MLRIFHVSDLHFEADPGRNQEQLRLLGQIREKFNLATDHLLVTGDVVDDGAAAQLEQARKALAPFTGRLLITPGNHDAGPLGNVYEEACVKRFEELLLQPLGIAHRYLAKVPAVDELSDGGDTRLLAVGLNSVRETPKVVDFATGELGKTQVDALEGYLTNPRYAGWWHLVYLHHRPYELKLLHPAMFLDDAKDLLDTVTNRAHVLAFGHSGRYKTRAERESLHEQMEIVPRARGIPYLLNANASVARQQCFVVTLNGPPEQGINVGLWTLR